MYTYMHIYVYIYIYICVCRYVDIYIYTYTYKEVAGSALASSMRPRWLIRYGESHEGCWFICRAASWQMD